MPEDASVRDDYLAAFAVANPHRDLPRLVYVNGWWCFYFRHDFGEWLDGRVRTAVLRDMTQRLLARARPSPLSDPPGD